MDATQPAAQPLPCPSVAPGPAGPWKIVVATDGSPCAAQAQELLLRIGFPAGTAICVVGVAPNPFLVAGAYGDTGFASCQVDQELVDAERAFLTGATSEAAERLAREGWQVTPLVRVGDVGHEILRAAGEFHANLIVVGTKGLTSLNRLLLGSTARSVTRYACCPVLVAHTPKAAVNRVVLAVDGSEHSARAVEVLARLPLPPAAEITVVHVLRPYHPAVERLEFLPGGRERFGPQIEAVRRRRQESADELVAAACRQLEAAGKRAEGTTRSGHPAEEVLTLAERCQADLLVMGTRGVSMLEGVLVGSVADAMLQNSPCSVLLVR